MKKTSIILCIAMILSMLTPFTAFAAVADDSTDGKITWAGYDWEVKCESEYLKEDFSACQCGYIYLDDSEQIHFELEKVGTNGYGGTHYIRLPQKATFWNDNFDIQFDVKMVEHGEFMGLVLYVPGNKRFYITWDKKGFSYYDGEDRRAYDFEFDNEWKTFRIERREDKLKLLLDGEQVLYIDLQPIYWNSAGETAFQLYSRSSTNLAANMLVKNMVIDNTTYEKAITMSPIDGDVFELGEPVTLTANAAIPSSPGFFGTNSTTVSYYLGDLKIGEKTVTRNGTLSGGGTTGDYKYTLSNLPVGSYTVRAEASDGTFSLPRTFTVENTYDVSISGNETVELGNTAEISFNNTSNEDISKVSYYVNGKLEETVEASPFDFSTTMKKVGVSSVYAVGHLADGSTITTDEIFVNVKTSSAGSFSLSQEYDLSYTFSSGTGKVEVNDGYFGLNMTHTENGITYVSRDNALAEYPLTPGGVGTYRIVVASGIAEVYRNGQLIFSDYLPRSSESSGLSYSGVSSVSLSGSGVKNELFRRELSGEREITEENFKIGSFYSFEFDKADASSESILLYDGDFEISLKFNGGIVAKTQDITGGAITEKTITDEVKAGYYRLTVYRGLAQLFRDNKFLASFRAPKIFHKTSVRRVMSGTNKSTFISVKNADDIYYFSEDFEKKNELDPLEYWYDFYGDVSASVSYGTMTISGDGIYLLDATAENPEIKWSMYVTDPADWNVSSGNSDSKSMAIALRYRTEFENIKLVYTHEVGLDSSGKRTQTGTWSIVEADGEEEVIDQSYTEVTANETTVATASYLMSLDSTHSLALSVDNDKLTLTCDGNTIFDGVELNFAGNGKFGFDTGDFGIIKIDNVSYAGNGKVNSGINYTYWESPTYQGTPSAYEGDAEGEAVLGLSTTGGYVSTMDKGDTWSVVPSKGYQQKNLIKLASGNWLCVYDTSQDQLFSVAYLLDSEWNLLNRTNIQHSGDGMYGRYGMGNALIQGTKKWGSAEYPRIYYTAGYGSEEKGEAWVYYSDDEGRTWEYCKTRMSLDTMNGMLIAESSLVELPDHTLRIYTRTDKGFVYSMDSYDGGVTFDKSTLKPTQFIAPSTCFSICRDEDNPNTYYMIWEYEPTTAWLSMVQLPRSRTAVAVSYDGCESWEYIMEADDRGPDDVELHHANNIMGVVHGVAYATSTHLYSKPRISADKRNGAMTYAVDPENVKTVKRFTSPHYVVPDYDNISKIASKQIVLPKTTGTAMIYGNMLPSKADSAEFVESAVIAKAVGATVTSTADGVSFTIGDGYIDFIKNSAEYAINGETKTASDICLSENGEYLNPKVIAEIFDKTYAESTYCHFLLTEKFVQSTLDGIENLVAGVSENLIICIESFKSINSWEELKTFFTDYKYLLNLYTSFSDTSYKNMYTAYTALDVSGISDYETLDAAIQTLIDAEKGRIGEFLDAINSASAGGDAAAIKTLLTDTYKDMLSFTIDTSDVKNDVAIYEKMTGLVYSSVSEVENVFLAAHEAQIYAETGKSDTISLSTVSRGFEGWNTLAGNSLGGTLKFVKNNENVTRLSAYAGLETDKEQVEDTFENGLVYYNDGAFDESVISSGITVDAASGTATFTGADGTLTIKGSEKAKSNTMITVFDMTKPEGTITGNFYTGNKFAYIDFVADGTSVGELSDTLKAAENLTYRVEMSLANVTVFAKAKDAEDTTYELVGTTTSSNNTKTVWEVTFDGDGATATLSNIGIYSALSSVRYETTGYVLQDDIHYTANGTNGNSMQDLIDSGNNIDSGNVMVDEKGNLLIEKQEGGSNSGIHFSENKALKGKFDHAVIEIRASLDDSAVAEGVPKYLYLYHNDNTMHRYSTYRFAPNTVNNTTNDVGSVYSWEKDQFFDIRFVTTVVDFDETDEPRTVASVFVKKAEETDWTCIAHDQLLTNVQSDISPDAQIDFITATVGMKFYVADISVKTYNRPAAEYSFINTAIDFPTVDHIFTFDYRRLDADSSTDFVIGGSDYSQTFKISSYGVESEETDGVFASVDINEDTWYRFFGKVKMKTESVFSFDTSKRIKNEISLYMMDANGNVTTLFEDLPMLKVSGKGGIRFTLPKTSTAGIELKNIRVYNGRALDIVSSVSDEGIATIVADFLNDDKSLNGTPVVIGGVYKDDILNGYNYSGVLENVSAYEIKRIQVDNIMHDNIEENSNIHYKLFMWSDFATLIPITNPATK